MDESELIKQVQKIRDDALDVLEFSTALARALIELCDETLHAVPAPGAHRKARRHLRVLPGLAVAGLLGWRLLRHPVVALTAGAVTLTATAAVLTTLPFVTAIPPRHAPRRPSVSRLAPHRDDRHVTAARPPVIGPRAGLTAPAPSPSSPAPRRPASPSPSSPVLPSPSASPSLTLSPSPSPSQSRNGCVTLLGIRLCI